MIRHVVCFKIVAPDAGQKARNIETVVTALRSLVGAVPQLRGLEVGRDVTDIEAHWDLALFTSFDTLEDVAAYQVHPEHVRVLATINPLVTARAVVDYEV